MDDRDEVRFEHVSTREPRAAAASPARVAAAFAISVGALGLLVHLSTGHAASITAAPIEEPVLAAVVATPAGTAAPSIAPEVVPSGTIAPPVVVEEGHIAMPDFTGLRVPAARRRARELGLRLVIRDPRGEAVNIYDAPRYRMRTQTIDVGTSVERGSIVRAVAADPTPRLVSGY